MAAIHDKLPPGTSLEWTGLSYEECLTGGQAPALYAMSLLIVFLCLAALYGSWSVPISVMLVVPLGVVGTLLADCMGAGMNAFDAAIEAAKLRLRPILMTSLAFVIGVFPLK